MIYLQLFWSFLQIGLFSIGGGYAAMPLIQAQVVEHYGWLSMNEFIDLVTIAEMTPGPIAINAATFVGTRIAGPGGALAATFGSIFPALFIVSLLSWLYTKYRKLPMLQSVLAALRPAVVALIASAGVSILLKVLFGEGSWTQPNVQGGFLFLFAFLALRKWKANPILTMVLCGLAQLVLGLIGFS